MSEKSRLLRKGARTGVLGSPSDLCIAAPIVDGDYDPAAHTDADRIGFYFDRTASAEKVGAVVMGTDILSVYAGGMAVGGYLRPGSTSDLTEGNLRWSGTDIEGRKNGMWVSLTAPIDAPELSGPLPAMSLNHSGSDNLNASASDNVVPWDTETFKDSGYVHDTVTNNSRIEVTKSSTYMVALGITTVMNPAALPRYQGSARLRINGTTDITDRNISTYARAANGANYSEFTSTWVVKLAAGDYFEVLIDRESTRTTAMDMLPNEQSLSIVEFVGGTGAGYPGRIVTVDPAGDGDSTTIAGAITIINALSPVPSTTAPATIIVAPGLYAAEVNPLVIPAGVTLASERGSNSVIVTPATATTHVFEVEGSAEVEGITVTGASGAGGIGFLADGGATTARVSTCTVLDCETAYRADGAGTQMALTACVAFRAPGAVLNTGLLATNDATINAVGPVTGGVAGVSPLTHGLFADGGSINAVGASINAATNGIHADDGGAVSTQGARIDDCTNALRVSNTGSNSKILTSASDLTDSTGYDLLIESSSATVNILGFFNPAKRSIAAGAVVNATGVDKQLGRAFLGGGAKVEGGLSVGTPGGAALFADIGEGGPYVNDEFGVSAVEFWTYDASAGSGSRFTRLASNAGTQLAADGDALVIGSRFPFFTGMLDVDTAAVLGSGTYTTEYWDGAAWVEAGFAVYGDEEELNFRGVTALTVVETQMIELSKFADGNMVAADDVTDEVPAWDDNQPHYVFRLINNGALTSGAVISDGKVRGDDFSIHADGDLIFWGNSRGKINITLVPDLLLQPGTNSPVSDDVDFSSNVETAGVRNEFSSTALDQAHYRLRIPDNIDTATPVLIRVIGYANNGNNGDVELGVRVVPFGTGSVIDGTLPEYGPFAAVVTVPGNTKEAFTAEIEVDVPGLPPGAFVALSIERDARGSNGNDTLSANYVMVMIDAEFASKRIA